MRRFLVGLKMINKAIGEEFQDSQVYLETLREFELVIKAVF